MKKCFSVLLTLALTFLIESSHADIVGTVFTSASTVAPGGTVTFTARLTNTLALPQQNITVTSTFTGSGTVLSASNSFTPFSLIPNPITINPSSVTFTISSFQPGQVADLSVIVQAQQSGSITNLVSVPGIPNPTIGFAIVPITGTTVTNLPVNLLLSISGGPTNVAVNDFVTYNVNLTNVGPGVAQNVLLTEPQFAGLKFISMLPSVPTTTTSSNVQFSIGTMTNGASQNYALTYQALDSGRFRLVTQTSTTQTNNFVTNTLEVLPPIIGNLAILSVTDQRFNGQNGLFEQIVTITNLSTNVITDARVYVTNLLAPNYLYNAIGTNGSRPYVTLASSIGATNTASVLMQFFVPTRTVINTGFAVEQGPINFSIPVPHGTAIPFSRFLNVRNSFKYSSLYVEFPSVVGRTYTLVYNPDVTFNNWIAAQPSIVANSSNSQFLDVSAQNAGDGVRVYKVIESQ